MKKIGIFYWPLKGNVEKVARAIAEKLDSYNVDIKSLGDISYKELFDYDFLIFGNSTVGASHWEDATKDNKWYVMLHELEKNHADFNWKKIAIFGLGDQVNYPNNFADSLEVTHSHFVKHKAKIVGNWPNIGYEFKESKSLVGNNFLGLVLDLDNQPETLEDYTSRWVEILKKEFI